MKKPLLIIGFDTEWVTDPTDPEHNVILSYQYACRIDAANRTDAAEWSGILYTRAARKIMQPDLPEEELIKVPARYPFRQLIGHAIAQGIKLRKLRKWPKEVIAAAHWTRADLAAMTDFPTFKRVFAGVHKTYTSLGGMGYKVKYLNNRNEHELKIILADTMLLAPGGERTLKALAPLYGGEKLDPGVATDGSLYIEHMDRLLADNPEHFEAYAIKDAEICALHISAMIAFIREDLRLPGKRLPATIGSIAVKFALRMWAEKEINIDDINGVISRKPELRWNKSSNRYISKEMITHHKMYDRYEDLAKACYFGGRNECFCYGPTSNMQGPRGPVYSPIDDIPVTFREYDLKAAYPTAMTTLQIPNYKAARHTTDPTDFRPDQLGFALLEFHFPQMTRFPCLPVAAANEHGLIYPLNGEAYATAPEIALALHMGAEIKILHGVVIPWIENSPRPFEMVMQELALRRAGHAAGTVNNALFKQLGNSLYGKLAQGLTDKTAYDTAEDHLKPIPPSDITNPYLAAHITGLVRALISELIASNWDGWTVVYLATDGFITNAPLSEISMDGPIAQHLSQARARMDGPALLDQKFEADQLLPWCTRGVATLQSTGKPKLAQGGMRAPDEVKDRNEWFIEAMLDRKPKQTYTSKEPFSFPEAHRTNADHIHKVRVKKMNFEFDFKRRPVDPVELNVRGRRHLTFGTIPWQTVHEFNATRALFDRWREQGNCLKTLADWRRWEEFQEGTAASKAGVSRRTKGGLVGQALRIFRRAYVRRKWGLPGRSYKLAAQALTLAGYPTTEQDFKDALRAPPPEHAISAAGPGVQALVGVLAKIWPSFKWKMLVRDPWEGYLQPANLPTTFAAELVGKTALRAAGTLESCKPGYDVINENATFPTRSPAGLVRTPEEIAENEALCDRFFGRRWVKPSITEERLPWVTPLSFATLLRPDEGEGVLLTELVCQSDWGSTNMLPRPTAH